MKPMNFESGNCLRSAVYMQGHDDIHIIALQVRARTITLLANPQNRIVKLIAMFVSSKCSLARIIQTKYTARKPLAMLSHYTVRSTTDINTLYKFSTLLVTMWSIFKYIRYLSITTSIKTSTCMKYP